MSVTERDFMEATAKLARCTEFQLGKRDDAEQAFAQAYYLVTGNSPKWSETFGHDEALEDIKDACVLMRAKLTTGSELVARLGPMPKCKLCIEQGRPPHFGSEPKCAFETGVFSSDNWNCATAGAVRHLMGESHSSEDGRAEAFYLRREDQSYGALFVPGHPQDVPNGNQVGPWRGGGFIAGYWYKHRGQTEMLIRVDPRNGGQEKDAARPLTLAEAEAALECWRLARKD